jgi:hypothetical protein
VCAGEIHLAVSLAFIDVAKITELAAPTAIVSRKKNSLSSSHFWNSVAIKKA